MAPFNTWYLQNAAAAAARAANTLVFAPGVVPPLVAPVPALPPVAPAFAIVPLAPAAAAFAASCRDGT